MNLYLRQLYAITSMYSRTPEVIEKAPVEILLGLLDAIQEITEKAYREEVGEGGAR